MRRILISALIGVATFAAPPIQAKRPVHTFSIVAQDPVTGDLGVAVQSHWFNVGAMVILIEMFQFRE